MPGKRRRNQDGRERREGNGDCGEEENIEALRNGKDMLFRKT